MEINAIDHRAAWFQFVGVGRTQSAFFSDCEVVSSPTLKIAPLASILLIWFDLHNFLRYVFSPGSTISPLRLNLRSIQIYRNLFIPKENT
jgi:hypothetical protein